MSVFIIASLSSIAIITFLLMQFIRYPKKILPVFKQISSDRIEFSALTLNSDGTDLPPQLLRLLQDLELGYNEKNINKIRLCLSKDFNYCGMNNDQIAHKIKRSWLFTKSKSFCVEVLHYKETETDIQASWLLKSDIGYMNLLGYMQNNNQVTSIIDTFLLKKEKDGLKILGNKHKKPIGFYQNFITMQARTYEVNCEIYRDLLPDLLNMPKKPCVTMLFTSNEEVRPPFPKYRFAQIKLSCKYKNKAGEYIITLPETDWIPVEFGKTFGYPKFICDEFIFESKEDTVLGSVEHGGKKLFSSTFSHDSKKANFYERISWTAPFIYIRKMLPPYAEQPIFLIKKISGRNHLIQCRAKLYTPGPFVEQFGTAEISLGKNTDYFGLIPERSLTKASIFSFRGDITLEHSILGVH